MEASPEFYIKKTESAWSKIEKLYASEDKQNKKTALRQAKSLINHLNTFSMEGAKRLNLKTEEIIESEIFKQLPKQTQTRFLQKYTT